jgi:uncharacterized protein (TIGR02996 family)
MYESVPLTDRWPMTSDGEALFRAVCESPADDTPRLVYADWLDENGRPERAEFIRLQCEAWSLVPGFTDVTAARTRASQLKREFGDSWYAELPDIPGVDWSDVFVRGFVNSAWIKAGKDVAAQLTAVFATAPVQHLKAINFGAKGLKVLFEMPEAARLETLRREGNGSGFSGEVRRQLDAAAQRFPRLRLSEDTSLNFKGLRSS